MFNPASPSPQRARLGVSLNFLTNGLMLTLVPRFPEIKQAFELSDGFYGIVVAAMGTGALLAGPLPAKMIARWGALPVSLVTTCLGALMLLSAALAPNPVIFAAALFVLGGLDANIDAAQNTQGVAVQLWAGRTIMNSLHATWSIGAALATLGGAVAAGLGIPLPIHAAVMALLIIGLAFLCWWLGTIPPEVRREQETDKHRSDAQAPGNWRRLLPVIPLAILAVAGVIPEDVTFNWSTVYLVEIFGVPVASAGVAITVMLVSQVLGRFISDPLSDRFGAAQVTCVGAGVVALGSLLVWLTPLPALVYVGLILTGLGCAPIVPMAYAAAGRVPGVAAGTGITLVGFTMRVGFALNSPIMGGISELAGLRMAFIVPVLAGLVAAYLAWYARPRPGASIR